MATDAAVDELERDLASASAEARRGAVERAGHLLRALPPAAVVDRLATALSRSAQDESWLVREATSFSLEHLAALRHAHAVPTLTALQGDPREPVRLSAQVVLARVRPSTATPQGTRRVDQNFYMAASKATHAVNNLLDTFFFLFQSVERDLLPTAPPKKAELFRADVAAARQRAELILAVVGGLKRLGAEPTWRRENLAELVARAVATARCGFEDSPVVINTSVPGHLQPEVPAGDYELAVNNLVRNAFEAFRARRRSGTIAVGAALVDDGWVELRVQDDGPGISPEVVAHLGEFGFTTKAGENAGCGLAMVRKTVEIDCGGELRVESTPGRGTTMTLRVPMSRRHGRTDA